MNVLSMKVQRREYNQEEIASKRNFHFRLSRASVSQLCEIESNCKMTGAWLNHKHYGSGGDISMTAYLIWK
jgi:hypothetical protein